MNKILLIIALFVAVFFLIVYLLKQRSNKELLHKRYTIATITQSEVQKNGALYHYTFQVKNQQYKGTFRHNNQKLKSGAHYFVSYDSTDPLQNFLEIQYQVPDSITEAPQEGWKKLP